MRFLAKSVFGTALLTSGFMAMAVLAGSTPVTAGSAPESVDSSLLPREAIEAALAEEAALPQSVSLPAMPDGSANAESKVDRRGGSLAQMVAANLSSTTDNSEEECLAIGVFFEAKSESLNGQLAVADVILNRANSGRFPSSVCGVLKQAGQFSFVRGGHLPSVPRGSQDWREAVAIAKIASADMADSGVGRALFFHATYVSPGWRLTRVATVGNHVFYR